MNTVELIIFICTLAGLLIGIFTVVDRLISIKSSKTILDFNIGMSHVLAPKSPKNKKRNKISSLFIGTSIDIGSNWAFACPYLLENNSLLPIKNITIALEYPSKFTFSNYAEFKDIGGDILKIEAPAELKRGIIYKDDRVEVRYNLELLRPGEKIGIFDPLNFSLELEKTNRVDSGLVTHLKKVEDFKELCIIDAIVFSEQCSPISKRVKILWFNTNSLDKLLGLTKSIVNSFWGGYYPKGIYFRFANPFKKKKHLVKQEFADVIIPTLEKIKTSKTSSFYYWTNPEDCEGALLKLNMPAFNYYQLTGDISTDDILREEGFRKM